MAKALAKTRKRYTPLDLVYSSSVSGALNQNYDASYQTYDPDRGLVPLEILFTVRATDPKKVIDPGIINGKLTDVRWYENVVDEAHNIKNFQSERWQILLHFNTKRRLLLTGTPLQNSLMELWSLMHFLMPALFRSRGEFAFWFSNPMNQMVEGEAAVNVKLVRRLHEVLRPFILRRLKSEVEKEVGSCC